MIEPLFVVLIVASLVVSGLLTGWLRRFALSRSIIDVPNARSSHRTPTPRGGGAAIVLATLIVLPVFAWQGVLSIASLWALLGAGLLVGGIGWLDDHRHVAAHWRLMIHFTAALWALIWLGGLPPLPIFGVVFDLGIVGDALAVLYLVWLLNLYNFMDGIDGIAGIEALTVCLGGAVLHQISSDDRAAWLIPVTLAAATSGFLVWNFPRARIFMGDAGSGFIGLMLGLLSLEASWVSSELFWGWLILLGAFVVDATITLIRRLIGGERVFNAHRSHAYQRVAREVGSHVPVSLAFGTLNVVWLLPIACMVAIGWVDGVLAIVLAYAPLVWLAWRNGAGRSDEAELVPTGRVEGVL